MLCITIHGMVRSRRPSTRVHTRNIVLLVPGTILQSNSNAYVVPFIMPVYAYIFLANMKIYSKLKSSTPTTV